jgi:hypothetical protein
METRSIRLERRSAPRGRAARGTVMVECLIVSLVSILFCAGCLGLYQLYDAKLHAMHDARALAWGKAYAREGCAPALDVANLFENVVEALDDPIGIGLPSDGAAPRPISGGGTFAHVAEGGSYVVQAPAVLAWQPANVRHNMQLACAEATQSQHGTLLDVALYGVRTLLPDLFRQGN